MGVQLIKYYLLIILLIPHIGFSETVFYAYSEYESGRHPIFCKYDPIIANIGIRQSLYTKTNLRINARYNHISCLLERNDEEYNALGIGIEYRLFK